jgi:hypothetical protein
MNRKRKKPGGPTRDENFEAFSRALPTLLKSDRGLFVALCGGRLIDKNPDEFALAERVAREHLGQRVLIQPVTESGMVDVYMDPPQGIGTAQLEERIREALAEPEESLTLEQFRAKMQEIADDTEPDWSTASKQVIRLTERDAAFIVDLLENPPPPNRKLKEAFEIYRNSVKDGHSGPLGNAKPWPEQSKMRTTTRPKSKLPLRQRKPPRCKQVLVILDNGLEVVELLAEETHPPPGTDSPDDGPIEFAVVRYKDVLVHVPLHCVLFLAGGIPSLETVSHLISPARHAIESFKAGLISNRVRRRAAERKARL